MNIIRTKNSQKHYNKMLKNVISRKNKYFRRNVHINSVNTNIKILRIKNDQEFNLEVKGYKSLPSTVAFFFYHISKNSGFTKYLNVNDSEYILTDSRNNKIISLNKALKDYPDFINIWIVKNNTIDYLKLKIGDIFFTR